jgi:hypothetical protein
MPAPEPNLKCFKCGEPLHVLYRKIYDGTPVMGACKKHQDDLATKLKWQIQPLTPLGHNAEVSGGASSASAAKRNRDGQ